MTARSSNCELESRHCPGAARHAEIGTPRDRAGMMVGTCVHHMLEAVISRDEGSLPQDAIDKAAVELIANGRSFEGAEPEFPTMETANRARDLALDFLDRDEIPDGAEWMRPELSVSLDRNWKVVERETCRCGHGAYKHPLAGLPESDPPLGCSACDCAGYDPAAQWTQALDLVAIYPDVVDDEEVLVAEGRDWKGGNCSRSWFDTLQGKGYAVSIKAICEENKIDADIIRRWTGSYMPWGGSFERDLNLRDFEHRDLLEDYRRSLQVAIAGHAGRRGKTPDELAEPGAGCSASFDGCPYFLRCQPAMDYWSGVQAWARRAQVAGREVSITEAAQMYTAATMMGQASAKLVKPGLSDSDSVLTADGRSLVGWKKRNKSVVEPNAAKWLAETWVEVAMRREPGSKEAQEAAAIAEGILRVPKALGVTTTKALLKRLGEMLDKDQIAELTARCLSEAPTRYLACWKAKEPPREPTGAELNEQLKRSLE